MMANLIMGIKNHRAINEALIKINKINVVGGINGSGKSTASRLLYTFLKTYSSDRWEVAVSEIIDNLNCIRDELIKDGIEVESKLPEELDYDDNYSDIIDCYLRLKEVVENYLDYANNKKEELINEIGIVYELFLKQLAKDFDNDFIIELQKYIEIKFDEHIQRMNEYRRIKKNFPNDEYTFDSIGSYFYEMSKVKHTKDFLSKNDINMENYNLFFKNVDNLKEEIENLNIDSYKFVISMLNLPIRLLFSENEDLSRHHVMHELFRKESLIDKEKIDFGFFIETSDSEYMLAEDYFKDNNYINDVFYIDNVSIFDLRDNSTELMGFGKGRNIEHIEHILNKISFADINNIKLNEKSSSILEKIDEIIGGKFEINKYSFPMSLKFHNENFNVNDKNIVSSGIKQIGIIQLLLICNMLKEDTYLIIDEPEVNLHPDWQFKFAEILVLLAKDLDVTLYLNSHSPFFIEAIDAFTEYYDMQEDINFYLTEESEVEGKYNFTKIESDELYRIYDNLGKPYDLIDQLRLKKHLGE